MGYDLAVVGAGVAGSVAAYQGAKQGLKVALIEKELLPRYKVCGGAITGKTLNLLESLEIKPPEEVLGLEVGSVKVKTPRGERSIGVGRRKLFLTYRSAFDFFLAGKASEAGAELFEGSRVGDIGLKGEPELQFKAGEIKASYIIGADGFYSLVARRAKMRGRYSSNELGVAAEYELRENPGLEAMEIHFGDSSFGYSWVFPKEGGATVGVAELASRLNGDIRSKLKGFASSLEWLDESRLPRAESFALPMGGIRRRVASDRVALAGDAAGFVDPLGGEGTYYAALSGYLAAESVLSAINGESLRGYQELTDREILPDLKALLRLARLFYFNLDFSYYLLNESRIMASMVRVLSTGKPNPKEFYGRALLYAVRELPGYAWKRLSESLRF